MPSFPTLRVCLLLVAAVIQAPFIFGAGKAETTQAQPAFPPLRQLLFAETEAEVLAIDGGDKEGVVVAHGLPLFNTEEFAKLMQPHFGKNITDDLVRKIGTDIANYVKAHDRVTTSLSIPKQDATRGTLRLILRTGRYRNVVFKGNKWFSSELLQSKLGVQPGDEILVSTLEGSLNWINANPFRRTQAIINNVAGDPSKVDLIVAVQERVPLRLVASYDNSNVKILGDNKYSFSLQHANVWGLDHQLTYQYTTCDRSDFYQAHSLDYRIPLPWRHYLQFLGAYSRVHPKIPTTSNVPVFQKGENMIADLRYILPIAKGKWDMEFTAGFDFKHANNSLEFGGQNADFKKYQIAQFTLGNTIVRSDKWGSWAMSTNVNVSPGNLTPFNDDWWFGATEGEGKSQKLLGARTGATAYYVYATISLQRSTALGKSGWEHALRATYQITNRNLVPSEQMSLGGMGTVRGYPERTLTGDTGYFVSSEFLSPVQKVTLPKKIFNAAAIQARGLAFFDCGEVSLLHLAPSDIFNDPQMSVGAGLRASLANRLSISADWGWRLKRPTPFKDGEGKEAPRPSAMRGHVRVILAF